MHRCRIRRAHLRAWAEATTVLVYTVGICLNVSVISFCLGADRCLWCAFVRTGKQHAVWIDLVRCESGFIGVSDKRRRKCTQKGSCTRSQSTWLMKSWATHFSSIVVAVVDDVGVFFHRIGRINQFKAWTLRVFCTESGRKYGPKQHEMNIFAPYQSISIESRLWNDLAHHVPHLLDGTAVGLCLMRARHTNNNRIP